MARASTVKDRSKKGQLFFWAALLVLAADQLTKFLVRVSLPLGESIPSEGLVRLTHTTNEGGIFGLSIGPFANQTFLLALSAIIGIAIILLYFFLPLGSELLKGVLGLVLGGAVGNVVDRLRFGEVTDFIDFGFWPVFNLADAAITVGVALLIYLLIFTARKT